MSSTARESIPLRHKSVRACQARSVVVYCRRKRQLRAIVLERRRDRFKRAADAAVPTRNGTPLKRSDCKALRMKFPNRRRPGVFIFPVTYFPTVFHRGKAKPLSDADEREELSG